MLLKDLKNTNISITYWEYEEMIRKIDRLEIENKYLKEQLECEKNRTHSSYWYGTITTTPLTTTYLSNTNTQTWSIKQSHLKNWSQTVSSYLTPSWKDL